MHDTPKPRDQSGSYDWNEAYTGRAENDYEAPDEELLAMIEPLGPGRALDLGCGAGGLAIAMVTCQFQAACTIHNAVKTMTYL